MVKRRHINSYNIENRCHFGIPGCEADLEACSSLRALVLGSSIRASMRVSVFACLAIVLAACGGDGGSKPLTGGLPNFNATVSDENGFPVLQDGTFAGLQNQIPVSVRIQTLEEQPVTAVLALPAGVSNTETRDQDFSIISEPNHGSLELVPGSAQFIYTPEADFFGSDIFVYLIAEEVPASVEISVLNVNDPPTIFADVQRVVEVGDSYTASLSASDPDNEPLDYQSRNLPDWLSLNSSTGELSGIPSVSDIGLFENIEFSVIDAEGLTGEVTGVRIEVIEGNDVPTLNIDQFPAVLDAGDAITVNLFPDDPDDDAVKVAFEANEYLDVSVVGGSVEVIATEVSEVTDVTLVLQATDVRGGVTRSSVPITIHPINSTGRGRTLFGRDESGDGIHLVVLGDGYREDQQSQFREDVESLIEQMQSDSGIETHFSAWNVHMVETPSVDSGSDDDVKRDVRDTVFNTGYFCEQVRRLICGDRSKIFGVAISEYPNFDQILVLVNDSRYGGSGGTIAIASTESVEIALHEMGHSIAGLADEYVDQYIVNTSIPDFSEGTFANVSTSSDPDTVPWQHWLSSDTTSALDDLSAQVGVFEGAYYQANGFYRPTENSLMRDYEGKLGPVNSEQWALSVYAKANPVIDISPVSRLLEVSAGEVVDFSVQPMFDSTVQSVQWSLDSRLIPDSGTLRPSISLNFPPGEFTVSLTVRDISGLIRKPEPHDGVFSWNWTVRAQ